MVAASTFNNGKNENLESEEGEDGSDGGTGGMISTTLPAFGMGFGASTPGSIEIDTQSNLASGRDNQEFDSIPFDLNAAVELANGYYVIETNEGWFLFDEEEQFIGRFDTLEEAMDKAYSLKPPRSPGP